MNRQCAVGRGNSCHHKKDRKKRYPDDGNENAGLRRKHIADDNTPFDQSKGPGKITEGVERCSRVLAFTGVIRNIDAIISMINLASEAGIERPLEPPPILPK